MTATVKRASLIGRLEEDFKQFEVLGYMCWWSIRNVNMTQEQFKKYLDECGLDSKYAREHNYMSAFKRALKNMEQARIIRIIEDNDMFVRCQFTAEKKVGGDGSVESYLDYDREASIRIDKGIYKKEKDFKKALSQGNKEINEQLIEYFYIEKVRYNSGDLTRYVQKIFKDNGDILPLRDQGNIYFVPFAFRALLEKVQNLIRLAVGDQRSFESVPMPNVRASRDMVASSITTEASSDYGKLLSEVDDLLEGKLQVTETWKETRLARIKKLASRLGRYEEVLGVDGAKLIEETKELEQRLLGARKLDI